jgi:two-component system NtrC family sensor kinase
VAERSLKTKILVAFLLVIFVLSASIAVLGYYIIKNDIIKRAQQKAIRDLKAARLVYEEEIDRIGKNLQIIDTDLPDAKIMQQLKLDYLLTEKNPQQVKSEIAKKVFRTAKPAGGTRIIPNEQLKQIQTGLIDNIKINIKPTPRAEPTDKKVLTDAMAKEYAIPVTDSTGNILKVIYGGRIINRDFSLVDRIRQLVYGNETYNKKPVGTVTIFQNDTRISTNVLNKQGQRAIGTRVSSEVYNRVVRQGKIWQDRAFVVTHWYKTAYEPIKNINGEIIGILYVGVLEKPFEDMARNIFIMFLGIVTIATIAAIFLSILIAEAISRPLTGIVEATRKYSNGEFSHQVEAKTRITEINTLGNAFNEMAYKIEERENKLKISNEKLAALNKSYIELISFVSHELKGILASATMNAYAVRDGYLGMVNFKQRKAIDSVTRNLDYLDATVKKFLNLGRIERGELSVNKAHVNLYEKVFEASIDSLQAVIKNKKLDIQNNIDPELSVNADGDLMLIVANNLLSNAVKYGYENGKITINAKTMPKNKIEIEVYNDSKPITDDQKNRLFKKFSRLKNDETKKVKGTGLGLYITKQIIQSHGGDIRLETKPNGNSFIFTLERS